MTATDKTALRNLLTAAKKERASVHARKEALASSSVERLYFHAGMEFQLDAVINTIREMLSC